MAGDKQAKQVARQAAKVALQNGASPAKAVEVGRGVARRALQVPYFTPLFFKSRRARMQSISGDPTVTYLPEARALNQRDPTVVGAAPGEVDTIQVSEAEKTGVSGFFDALPSWFVPVALGAAVLIGIVLINRMTKNPPEVAED